MKISHFIFPQSHKSHQLQFLHSLISTSLFDSIHPTNRFHGGRSSPLGDKIEPVLGEMEFHEHSVSVPPPPPPLKAEELGIERSCEGGKREESEVQAEDRAATAATADEGEESGRERLKRHRREMAGRVWIPELWGQEEFLKDWIDCSGFDASLFPAGIGSARAALVEEGRRANNGGFRLENRC